MSGFLARSRRTFKKSLLQCIPGGLKFPALKFWMLIKFDFSSKTGILVVKFAFATANLKIETLRMRKRFARVLPLHGACGVWIARAWKMRTDHKSERPICCCHKLVTWTVGLACHRCLAKCLFISWTIFTGRLTLLVLISVRWTTDTKAARNKLKSSDTTCKEGGRGKLVTHNFYFHRRTVC